MGRAYIQTKERWIRVCCPVGCEQRNRSHTQTHNRNNTTRDTTRTTPEWRGRSEGAGIPTYEAALDSGVLSCRV